VKSHYGRKPRAGASGGLRKQLRYFSPSGRVWLPIAGAFLFARIIGELRELHRTEHVDLIHAHGPLPSGHAAMLAGKELNIPYIVSIYGLDDFPSAEQSGQAEKWCHRITHRVCAESRRVVCASEHVREQVLERTGRTCRTSVVYRGVDPELFSSSPEASSGPMIVLGGGNLTAGAGHDLLIRATAALLEEFPTVSLEILGDGPERSRLEALVRELNLVNGVRFLGCPSRSEVAAAMKRCALFALPSRSEGIECMHLEALSCGRPVIGGRAQGIAEVIQHGTNGFLVGPENERELTLAMAMLLREPQRRYSLGVAARDTILDRFTLGQQAQNLARVYRDVVP
jgi:glycosyltransferase involved in cell wall biosynthesis